MSVKTVKEFFGEVEGDKALQEKLKTLSEKAKTSMASAVAELIEIAAAKGFVFTQQDFADARNEPPALQSEKGRTADQIGVPYECTGATAWQGHPPDPEGCLALWGCGVQHPMYGGPHIPICATRPV